MKVVALIGTWLERAREKEVRAANPEVVGFLERDNELCSAASIRRCAAELQELFQLDIDTSSEEV